MDHKETTITIGRYRFRFYYESPTWCQVYISGGDLSSEKYLGGDSLKIVKERLINKISNVVHLPSKIQIQNRKVCWLMSLGETHTCLFVTQDSPLSFFLVLMWVLGLATTRYTTEAAKRNPVMALPKDIHKEIFAAQKSLNPRSQSVLTNIEKHIDILRNYLEIPRRQIDILE